MARQCFVAIALLAVAVSASPVEYGHYGAPALVHAPLAVHAPVVKHVVAEPVGLPGLTPVPPRGELELPNDDFQ
uniref:Uncharacterized protein n=1 Tax=Anopheles stephensi TaxID=30069 RepID=A0A182YKA9_ANOST